MLGKSIFVFISVVDIIVAVNRNPLPHVAILVILYHISVERGHVKNVRGHVCKMGCQHGTCICLGIICCANTVNVIKNDTVANLSHPLPFERPLHHIKPMAASTYFYYFLFKRLRKSVSPFKWNGIT